MVENEEKKDIPGMKESGEFAEGAWEREGDRVWIPDEGPKVPHEMTPEEEEAVRQRLEETRKGLEIPEEELHPEYKKLVGIGAAPETEEEKKEKVRYAKCGECGAMVPVDQIHDNGSYLVCSKCV